MAPLVSICIPCYNAQTWIAAAVESALAQTWQPLEIIVVDDGSTDDSARVVHQFTNRGVRVLSQPNAGQSAAANAALRLARGDLIKFFDADDLLSPDMVERQVRSLAGCSQHLAYSEWARFQTDPAKAVFRIRPSWHDAPPVEWLVETWADGGPMMQCGQFLIPRALLDQVGGWDERLSLINDFEFFTRLILASEGIVFTPGARLFYRSNVSGSLSAQRSAVAWRSAALSLRLGTDYLLRAEDSVGTRRAAGNILQGLVYSMYPNMPVLTAELERRIAELGGSPLRAQGGKGFQFASRVLGWKTARWLQILAGKHPWPVRSARPSGPSPATTV